jgi:hypothetical protein
MAEGSKDLSRYTTIQRREWCVTVGHRPYLVHRLVALAWVPNPDGHNVVVYVNGDRSDPRAENLRWVRTGMSATAVYPHWAKRLTPELVHWIRGQLRTGRAQKDLAMELGVSISTISKINRGRLWSRV